MAEEQAHIEGVLSMLELLDVTAYERDTLPDVLPPVYAEVEVTRRTGGNGRAGGPAATFGLFEITERSTSRNAAQLREHRDKFAAIEGATLTVDGSPTTPVEFGGADPISPEGGWYVGFRTWTYALF